ncbi:cytochrome P450 [Pseudoneurospora amorphoporcata]|uniref:Cytochrome P450 n=1 Tax=Pseudoneurospora amorphoporcata TaxID=241081 RepID=A0AAN6NRD0_9PEZI|nr:cytochrome P450 [Pseudoneurospora amorphoporcata]
MPPSGNPFSFSRVTLLALVEVLTVKKTTYRDALPLSTTSLVLAILAVNYVFFLTWKLYLYPVYFHPLSNFPAPKVVSLWRVLARFRGKAPPGQLLLELTERTPNDGIIILQGAFGTSMLITKPAPLADILVHHPYDFAKYDTIRNFLRPVLGDGLVVVEGEQHKFLRKNTQPAFKFGHIKELYPTMWSKAIELNNILKEELSGLERRGNDDTRIEINAWAGKVTLDIIGIAAFGRDFHVLERPHHPLVKNYADLLEPGPAKFAYFFFTLTFSKKFVDLFPWEVSRRFNRTTTEIRSICAQLVRDKKAAIERLGDDQFDILSLLIKSNNFSEAELVDQLLTFLAAGHETTSSALTWATYLLAKDREMQSTLRSELRAALPDFPNFAPGQDIAGILEHLPYLNGVMNETLRLYPTVPMTVRTSICDTTVLGHPIKKGTEIMISPWIINRYTRNWGDNPTEFRPERWIDQDGTHMAEAGTKRPTQKPNNTGGVMSNYAQMTFLHGPRSCIGQGFAKAELRCLLAAFVLAFEWELGMDEKDIMSDGVITIKPNNGMYLKLRPLDGGRKS